ncbi:class I SAM-dependent methyltransferase [Nanoarchaeota archaeon]
MPEIKSRLLDEAYIEIYKSRADIIKQFDTGQACFMGGSIDYNPGLILDVACGCGGSSYNIAKKFPDSEVIGIDKDESALEVANELFSDLENISFESGNVYDLKRYRGAASIVSVLNSLHHFNNLRLALKQIYDSLQQGGEFFFQDLDRMAQDSFLEKMVIGGYILSRILIPDKVYLKLVKRDALFLSLLSSVAAYTPLEIKRALEKENFSVNFIEPIEESYRGFASK